MTGTCNGCQNKIATSATSSAAGKRVNKARHPTKAEMHANNYSRMHTVIYARNTVSWMRMFREKLAKMNRRKIGHPYSYTNSMIMQVLLIMGLNNLN